MHVLDRLLFVEVHPSAICNGVGCFLMAPVMIFPIRKEEIVDQWTFSLVTADSSAISLEVFVWYV